MTTRARIARWLAGDMRSPDEVRAAVYLVGGGTGAQQSRFWLLLVLSAGIATAGIVSDSTATVIGAMIVAPLAVPIQGSAAAVAYGELRPPPGSMLIVLSAMALVVGIGALLAVLLPELSDPADYSQITGRASRLGRRRRRAAALPDQCTGDRESSGR